VYEDAGVTDILFLYLNEPAALSPPPPTTTAETEVTPAGATQENVPAVTYASCPCTKVGVMLFEAALHGPVPVAFVAFTLNVYAVPTLKPETLNGEDAPVAVKQLGVEVAVYPVIVAGNPAQAGAVKGTEAVVLPAEIVAVPIVGAPGTAGHVLAPFACICWVTVQIPEKLGIRDSPYKLMGTSECYRDR
jgi:hypothetical protein